MNIHTIRTRVADIARISDNDDEVSHRLEDELMLDFIRHVERNGDARFSAMAKEVLKTKEIEFCRWYS